MAFDPIQIIGIIILAIVAYFVIRWLAINYPPRSVRLGFCPKCGGQRVRTSNKNLAIFIPTHAQYHCLDCDFQGPTLPEAHNEEDLKKIQAKLRNKKKHKKK
jgi:predicted RNA-binding Zn-ribbon protein involved in translation (DUF1610 family)